MGVNITTVAYLRVWIIEIGSTIILMVVKAQGIYMYIYVIYINLRRICQWKLSHFTWKG